MQDEQSPREILQSIVAYLIANPETSARMIAAELGVDKTSINSVLYSNKRVFKPLGDKPPMWSVRTEPDNDPIEPVIDGTARADHPNLTVNPSHRFLEDARKAEATHDYELASIYYELSRRTGSKQSHTLSRVPSSINEPSRNRPVPSNHQSETLDDDTINEIEILIQQFPGIEIGEIESLTGLFHDDVVRATRRFRYLVSSDESRSSEFSELHLQLLDGISEAGTLAFPLSSDEYDELVRKRMVFGRTSARIGQIFGSWRRACELAGVEAPRPVRSHYERRWTERELAEVVARYLRDPTYRGSHHRYDEWRSAYQQADELPSSGTLKNYLGPSWDTVRNHGLRVLRESWLNEAERDISDE